MLTDSLRLVPKLGLRFKQLSLYLDVLRDCYEAFVIYRCHALDASHLRYADDLLISGVHAASSNILWPTWGARLTSAASWPCSR